MQIPTWVPALIIVLPFSAFVICALLGFKLRERSAIVALILTGSSSLLCLYAFGATIASAIAGEHTFASHIWLRIIVAVEPIAFIIPIGYAIDPLTAIMLLVVGFIGWWIMLYSVGYMEGDPRYSRFFAYLALFMASMLGLVLANSFVMLYICWELVGLCSYLLIGFWYERTSVMRACKKAFLVTRLGDTGFALGIFLIFMVTGSVAFYDGGGISGVFSFVEHADVQQRVWLTIAATLLFIGAIGKSAQFPLHVWLPDAMEGPTPVSALIHAATMVAAGVYMVARCYVLFDPHNVPAIGILGGALSIHPQIIVAYIGGFTAFMAATIAIAQDDIKRILAYSTISQLGYMMMGLGLGGYTAGTFHLMTHAFFKALLFLGAGSVIHAMHTNDIYQMGGLNKAMPITFATYVVGMSALAGVPPLSGFWSKDEILLSAFLHNKLLWVVGEAAAFLTALYMTRQVCIVFLHKPRLHDAHPHESPMVMWLPLVVLAIGAIIAGLPGMPWFNLYGQFVHYGEGAGETHGAPALLVMLVSIAMAIAGIWLGYHLYGRRQVASSREDPLRISLGKLYDFLEAKWRLDWYESNITRSAFFGVASMSRWFDLSVVDGTVNVIGYVTARIFAVIHRAFDLYVVDGVVNAIAFVTGKVGDVFRRIHTGLVRHYMLFVLIGFVIAIVLSLWQVILYAQP